MITRSPICILGSNSFAGSTFARFILKKGYRVLGISRSKPSLPTLLLLKDSENYFGYQYEQIDINSGYKEFESLLIREKPEFIFDFAGQGMVAESWEKPEQWFQTNLVSKIRLLEYLKNQSWLVKYIRVSTPEVYGNSINKIPETANYSPTTPYAITHASIDMTLRAYFARYGFPAVIGRFSNFYGPGQQLYRIIPKTILSPSRGLKIPLHGNGSSERSFIYSDDINTALFSLAEHGVYGQVYHFSSKELISIRSLVDLIIRNLGLEFNDCVDMVEDRPSKDHKYLMNSDKANRDLSWEAKISIEAGLKETIKWFTNYSVELAQIPLDYVHKP